MMMRVDRLLVEQGLAASRTAAARLIDAGRVSWHDGDTQRPVTKASLSLPLDALLQVTPDEADRFVCRGGLKLAGALAHTGLDLTGCRVLDIGQSTGGFTDCALQAGAAQVVGIDVGHDQLAQRLRDDPRVTALEGVNARALDQAVILTANGGQPFDVLVCDVSFISLTLVLPPALPLLKSGGYLLSLVKPQFEVGRDGIGKGGIVRDGRLYGRMWEKIQTMLTGEGMTILDAFDSPITGGDGNREFFIWAQR